MTTLFKHLGVLFLFVITILGGIGIWLGWLAMLGAGVLSILILSGVAVTGGWTLVVALACILPICVVIAMIGGASLAASAN